MKKKKLLSMICALSLMTSPQFSVTNAAGVSAPSPVSAVSEAAYTETEIDGVLYYVYDDHAEIAGHGKELMPEELIIPETVSGKPVTKFVDSLDFSGYPTFFNSSVKRFSMPDSMTEFPDKLYLSSLEYLKLPAHLTDIPAYSIKYIGTDELVLPEDLKVLKAYSLYNVYAKTITVPAKTEKIERKAFNANNIKDITILNPNCVIEDSPETIANKVNVEDITFDYTGIIRGYKNSTTQEYAEKYGYRFIDVENPPAYLEPIKITTRMPDTPLPKTRDTTRVQFESFIINEPMVEWGEFEYECEFANNLKVLDKSVSIFNKTVSLDALVSNPDQLDITPYKITITKATDQNGNDISEYLPWKVKEYTEIPQVTRYDPYATTTTTTVTTSSATPVFTGLPEECTRINAFFNTPYLTNEKGEELKLRADMVTLHCWSPDTIDDGVVRTAANECLEKVIDKIKGKTDDPYYFKLSVSQNLADLFNAEYAQQTNCTLVYVTCDSLMLINGTERTMSSSYDTYPAFTLPTTAPVTTTGNKTTTTSGIKTTTTTAAPVTTSTVPFSSTTSESSATTTAPVTTSSTAFTSVTTAPAKVSSGDTNGDGSINLKDVVMLRRYIAGGWNVTVDEKLADINRDGAVNLKDVVLLRRYIAGGWNVKLPE